MPRLTSPIPRLRIRTILLIVNLIVILVPLSGIYFFKLYETELVHQTEGELIAQGAFISAMFRQHITAEEKSDFGRQLAFPPPVLDERYKPVPAQLDLSTATLLPKRPDAVPTENVPDPKALAIARRIVPILEEARLTTHAAFSLMDNQGTVLIGPESGLSLAHLPEVQQAMEGIYASTIRERASSSGTALASISRDTIFRAFAAYPIYENDRLYGIVLLSRSPRNILKALYEEREGALQAAGMVAVAVLLISLLTSLAISRPVRALLGQVRSIAEGKKVTPIASPVTREIAELSAQMTLMAEKLQARSDYIRQFALQLSHEFKTPLTSIQGAIELLREHNKEMSREQRERFLGNTLEDTKRLNNLVGRMLELARADALEPRGESSDIGELMSRLTTRYCERGLILQFMQEKNFPALPLPTDIAETVLVNLFDNSLQHGATEVIVTADINNTAPVLTVSDNGQGISSANAGQLFTPFFTTRRDQGGTGLGLSIIQALLKAHAAEIVLQSSAPHAVFQIRFSPLAMG